MCIIGFQFLPDNLSLIYEVSELVYFVSFSFWLTHFLLNVVDTFQWIFYIYIYSLFTSISALLLDRTYYNAYMCKGFELNIDSVASRYQIAVQPLCKLTVVLSLICAQAKKIWLSFIVGILTRKDLSKSWLWRHWWIVWKPLQFVYSFITRYQSNGCFKLSWVFSFLWNNPVRLIFAAFCETNLKQFQLVHHNFSWKI